MSLLVPDITRKRQVDKTTSRSKFENGDNDKEYKVEIIYDIVVYIQKSEDHLSGLYHSIFWKDYLEEKTTWKPTLTIKHLCRLITIFHKEYPVKPSVTLLPINSDLSMARPIVKSTIRSKVSVTK